MKLEWASSKKSYIRKDGKKYIIMDSAIQPVHTAEMKHFGIIRQVQEFNPTSKTTGESDAQNATSVFLQEKDG